METFGCDAQYLSALAHRDVAPISNGQTPVREGPKQLTKRDLGRCCFRHEPAGAGQDEGFEESSSLQQGVFGVCSCDGFLGSCAHPLYTERLPTWPPRGCAHRTRTCDVRMESLGVRRVFLAPRASAA